MGSTELQVREPPRARSLRLQKQSLEPARQELVRVRQLPSEPAGAVRYEAAFSRQSESNLVGMECAAPGDRGERSGAIYGGQLPRQLSRRSRRCERSAVDSSQHRHKVRRPPPAQPMEGPGGQAAASTDLHDRATTGTGSETSTTASAASMRAQARWPAAACPELRSWCRAA